MQNKIVSAYWPLDEQPLTLGNVLTFRQELELVAHLQNADEISITFNPSVQTLFLNGSWLSEALQSQRRLSISFSSNPPLYFDWPPPDPLIRNLSYGSLRKISFLHRASGLVPILSWPSTTIDLAKACYLEWKSRWKNPILAIHLKNQNGGPEESNADLNSWYCLFRQNPNFLFVLLGNDILPTEFFELLNVKSAQNLGMNLSTQLAFTGIADGFMGMATGVCSGAIFSRTPYVIFKHPKHHAEEMASELWNTSSFQFSSESQELRMEIDSIENLTSALNSLSKRNGVKNE